VAAGVTASRQTSLESVFTGRVSFGVGSAFSGIGKWDESPGLLAAHNGKFKF